MGPIQVTVPKKMNLPISEPNQPVFRPGWIGMLPLCVWLSGLSGGVASCIGEVY